MALLVVFIYCSELCESALLVVVMMMMMLQMRCFVSISF